LALGAGRFGNFGRNVFHGPGIDNWDFAAFKRVTVSEGRHLEVRAELLNLFNHTQFLNPVSSVADAEFGRIRDTRDPRIVQPLAAFLVLRRQGDITGVLDLFRFVLRPPRYNLFKCPKSTAPCVHSTVRTAVLCW
jgi:hypothetical protein